MSLRTLCVTYRVAFPQLKRRTRWCAILTAANEIINPNEEATQPPRHHHRHNELPHQSEADQGLTVHTFHIFLAISSV